MRNQARRVSELDGYDVGFFDGFFSGFVVVLLGILWIYFLGFTITTAVLLPVVSGIVFLAVLIMLSKRGDKC